MAPQSSPLATQSSIGTSEDIQQTTSSASESQQPSSSLENAGDVYSYYYAPSQTDLPCPKPKPPQVIGVASSSTNGLASTRSAESAGGGKAVAGATGGVQSSRILEASSRSLVPATTKDWNDLPSLKSIAVRIPEIVEGERTRPMVVLDPILQQSTSANLEAIFSRDAGVQVATALYSQYLADVGIPPFPITIGKTILFLLSRLPHETRARQTLEEHTSLCAETSHQVQLQDLFDGLLVTQSELRALYRASDAEMISSDFRVAEVVDLSNGVEARKPAPIPTPPPAPSPPPVVTILTLDGLVAWFSARPHLFQERPNSNRAILDLALKMYPLSALSKTSGASMEEREAVLTMNSYIDFHDSTHLDSFPITSITAMLYLLRISNLPASTRLIEVLPPWIPSHPRFLPSQPHEAGHKLQALFAILQSALLRVWTAWRNLDPSAPLPTPLCLDERFNREFFGTASAEGVIQPQISAAAATASPTSSAPKPSPNALPLASTFQPALSHLQRRNPPLAQLSSPSQQHHQHPNSSQRLSPQSPRLAGFQFPSLPNLQRRRRSSSWAICRW
ncbi:hypothetical protein BCR35DRAFT_25357 [Leucosporidium creatinivorum]|uniref:Uncharacterized protein n=1 Tax=Leucosporidium creatinivorum TaxID=106004 RepID=A0A1Y2CS52_9BASI|nr:hypothetical protein BCR35DRAFT_25357 [Leucosporidium creatinivorum]